MDRKTRRALRALERAREARVNQLVAEVLSEGLDRSLIGDRLVERVLEDARILELDLLRQALGS
ncbi:MAG: hypothetical protein ACRD02_13170 [Acidimicrobiia bacterium]